MILCSPRSSTTTEQGRFQASTGILFELGGRSFGSRVIRLRCRLERRLLFQPRNIRSCNSGPRRSEKSIARILDLVLIAAPCFLRSRCSSVDLGCTDLSIGLRSRSRLVLRRIGHRLEILWCCHRYLNLSPQVGSEPRDCPLSWLIESTSCPHWLCGTWPHRRPASWLRRRVQFQNHRQR